MNVSLDTLDEAKFARVTRWGRLPQVLKGIDAAQKAGLRVKINAVALKGFNEDELFTTPSWIQVFIGQRILPRECHGIAKVLTKADVEDYLARINGALNQTVSRMPTHRAFVDRFCPWKEAA